MKTPIMWLLASSALAMSPALACEDEPPEPVTEIRSGATLFDWEAREQQVSSGDQRIGPMAVEDFSPEAQDIQNQISAFFGTKITGVPITAATVAKHPGLYKHQTLLGLELNERGAMPPREREMVILRTAWLVRSPFEWGEHVKYGKRLGLTTEEIERITQGSSAEGWGEHDRAVLRGVEELLGDYAVSDETWATLGKTWDEKQLMELPGLVGSYTLTAMLFSTLRFGLMPGNEGFKQR